MGLVHLLLFSRQAITHAQIKHGLMLKLVYGNPQVVLNDHSCIYNNVHAYRLGWALVLHDSIDIVDDHDSHHHDC